MVVRSVSAPSGGALTDASAVPREEDDTSVSETPMPTPALLRPPAPSPSATPTPSTSASARFGRVDDDGTVYLITDDGERPVGQWSAGPPADGLAFFARKYDDLVVELDLVSRRLADQRATAADADKVVARVREALVEPSFVGDVAGLVARCDALASAAQSARDVERVRRAEQREAAMGRRSALADEADALQGSTAWKATTERFAEIVEEWKAIPRSDRAAEQALWQRISAARTAFDKRRRQHFTELDAQRKEATQRKRELIATAEQLATSTDWAGTTRRLRDLMADWKAAPRTSKADEDKLWKRFKAAQDAFFAARQASEDAEQESLRANLPAKEALVAEAEALLPLDDVKRAKSALRGIQERYDRAGDLPRGERDRLDARLRKVEEAVRGAEAAAWTATRGSGTTDAFAQALQRLQEKHDAALARGDAATAQALEAQIASTRALIGR